MRKEEEKKGRLALFWLLDFRKLFLPLLLLAVRLQRLPPPAHVHFVFRLVPCRLTKETFFTSSTFPHFYFSIVFPICSFHDTDIT